MFAIHSPQTVSMTTDQDGKEAPGIINFSYAGADTSRCKMQIQHDGRSWTFVFNQRGYLVEQTFDDGSHKDDHPVEPLTDADYIVGGVDTRSFNPYTHKAPADADTLARDGLTPGWKAPAGQDPKEAQAVRDKAYSDAHGEAQKAIDAQRKRMDEKPEEMVARERKERDEKFKQVSDSLAKQKPAGAAPKIMGEPDQRDNAARPGNVTTSRSMNPDHSYDSEGNPIGTRPA